MEQVGPIKERSPAYSFSYEELKKAVGDLSKGIDPLKKEQYLNDAEFEKASATSARSSRPTSDLSHEKPPCIGPRLAAWRVRQAQAVEAAAAQEGRWALLGLTDLF